MKKYTFLILSMAVIYLTSCVPARQFEDAKTALNKCAGDTSLLNRQLRDKTSDIADLNAQAIVYSKEINLLRKDSVDITNRYDNMVKTNQELRDIENTLNNRINQLLALSSTENQSLREDLQKKEDLLNAKEKELGLKEKQINESEKTFAVQQANIDKLNSDLVDREKRVKELETMMAQQEQQSKDLKNKIDQALSGFSASDLTVERKNGKVYVSLSEKLLFASGSTTVDVKGKDALKKLAEVLKSNADIQIEIEGHTDNVPMKGTNFPKDNWDLSVLRATSIVKILTYENGVEGKRVTAAGRGEYFPVAGNETNEGKSKNRRTEIILSPNLDSLYSILNPK